MFGANNMPQRKLSENDVKWIKAHLFLSKAEIASKFNISISTTNRYLDEEYRTREREQVKEYNRRKPPYAKNCYKCSAKVKGHKRCIMCTCLIHEGSKCEWCLALED